MLTALLSTRSTIWKNDICRSSVPALGTMARLIGLVTKACSVRRCEESPTAVELLSKCAPMCIELGAVRAFGPSPGDWYVQPRWQAEWGTEKNAPLSAFGH